MDMKSTAQKKSIALPLVISIIAISFSAIIVKWSTAPATILSMYRMIFGTLFLCCRLCGLKKEFLSIQQRMVFIIFCLAYFWGPFCVVVWLFKVTIAQALRLSLLCSRWLPY